MKSQKSGISRKQRVQVVLEGARVSDPLGVGRPGDVITDVGEAAVDVLIVDEREFAGNRIKHIHVESIVVEGDAL